MSGTLKKIDLNSEILFNLDSTNLNLNIDSFFKYNLTKNINFNSEFVKNLIKYIINEENDFQKRKNYDPLYFKEHNTFNNKNTIHLIIELYELVKREEFKPDWEELNKFETFLINLYYNYFKNEICNAIYINKFIEYLQQLKYQLSDKNVISTYLNENEYLDFSEFDDDFSLNNDNSKNKFFYINDLNSNFHLILYSYSIKYTINNYCEYAKIKINRGTLSYDKHKNWGFNFLNKVFDKYKITEKKEQYINEFKDKIDIFFKLFKIDGYGYDKKFGNYNDKNNVRSNVVLILWSVFNTEKTGESLFEKKLLNELIDKTDVNDIINIISAKLERVGDIFKNEYDSDENFRTKINKMGFTNDFWGNSYKKSLHMIKHKTDNYIDFKKIYIPAIMSLGAVAAYELYRKNKKKY
jgi:hypothetical protein